jgi:hypothetical protein
MTSRHLLCLLVLLVLDCVIAAGSACAEQRPGPDPELVGTIGGAVLPSGGAKGGAATAFSLTGERRWSLTGTQEVRLGAVGSFEQTYYQSSFSLVATGRDIRWFGSGVYGLGYGLGLGFGVFSPKGGYHADDGSSLEVMILAAPVLLRLGAARNIELSLQAGIVRLLSFNEWAPAASLGIGFTTCWPLCGPSVSPPPAIR